MLFLEGHALNGIGYRVGIHAGITTGVHATEGKGVYLALDEELADHFHAGTGSRKFKCRFSLKNACEAFGNVVVGALLEGDEITKPIKKTDSDWLKANKRAFQLTMKTGWNEDAFQEHLDSVLKQMGFDGVYVDSSYRWVVVFDPKNVQVLEEIH